MAGKRDNLMKIILKLSFAGTGGTEGGIKTSDHGAKDVSGVVRRENWYVAGYNSPLRREEATLAGKKVRICIQTQNCSSAPSPFATSRVTICFNVIPSVTVIVYAERLPSRQYA